MQSSNSDLVSNPLTLSFQNAALEGEYLAEVAKRRWPVLLFIFCFDVVCYLFRITAKCIQLLVESGPLHVLGRGWDLAREFGPQLANMAVLYLFLGLLNRRSRRLGDRAARQEEVLLSMCMAFAICNLLASLSPDNSQDYVYVAFFLICTSTFLKIRWWVGTVIQAVPTALVQMLVLAGPNGGNWLLVNLLGQRSAAGAPAMDPLPGTCGSCSSGSGQSAAGGCPQDEGLVSGVRGGPEGAGGGAGGSFSSGMGFAAFLPPDAAVHVAVAWAVGGLMAYLNDWYRRQMFAHSKLAALAHSSELMEAQARIAAQRALAAAQAQAAQRALSVAREKAANEAKSEFMSLMCHEVRTPLNGCLASAEMLLETPLLAEQRELAATIRVSGSILLSTVSNFLDFFKLEAGKALDIVRTSTDLRHLVADVHCIIEAMIGRGGEVVLLDPHMQGLMSYLVYCDADRVRGILLNLYTNAAKFTKQGHIQLRVREVPPGYAPEPNLSYSSIVVSPPRYNSKSKGGSSGKDWADADTSRRAHMDMHVAVAGARAQPERRVGPEGPAPAGTPVGEETAAALHSAPAPAMRATEASVHDAAGAPRLGEAEPCGCDGPSSSRLCSHAGRAAGVNSGDSLPKEPGASRDRSPFHKPACRRRSGLAALGQAVSAAIAGSGAGGAARSKHASCNGRHAVGEETSSMPLNCSGRAAPSSAQREREGEAGATSGEGDGPVSGCGAETGLRDQDGSEATVCSSAGGGSAGAGNTSASTSTAGAGGEDSARRWLLFEVADTGTGITPEALRTLFREYVQGTEDEMRKPRSKGGTGLGLSICSKQVGLLGGRIGAYSCPGQGSIFWFTIPLIEVPADHSDAAGRGTAPSASSPAVAQQQQQPGSEHWPQPLLSRPQADRPLASSNVPSGPGSGFGESSGLVGFPETPRGAGSSPNDALVDAELEYSPAAGFGRAPTACLGVCDSRAALGQPVAHCATNNSHEVAPREVADAAVAAAVQRQPCGNAPCSTGGAPTVAANGQWLQAVSHDTCIAGATPLPPKPATSLPVCASSDALGDASWEGSLWRTSNISACDVGPLTSTDSCPPTSREQDEGHAPRHPDACNVASTGRCLGQGWPLSMGGSLAANGDAAAEALRPKGVSGGASRPTTSSQEGALPEAAGQVAPTQGVTTTDSGVEMGGVASAASRMADPSIGSAPGWADGVGKWRRDSVGTDGSDGSVGLRRSVGGSGCQLPTPAAMSAGPLDGLSSLYGAGSPAAGSSALAAAGPTGVATLPRVTSAAKVDFQTLVGRRVLLVEDNLINQTVARKMLTSLGLQCEVASNGLEALQRIERAMLTAMQQVPQASSAAGACSANGVRASGSGGGSNPVVSSAAATQGTTTGHGGETVTSGSGTCSCAKSDPPQCQTGFHPTASQQQRGSPFDGPNVDSSFGAARSGDVSPDVSLPYDVVLMDMAMPVMGGVDSTRAIRRLGCQVPIVAMTANALERDREECRLAGMNAFLSKPVLKDRLAESLVAVLRAPQREDIAQRGLQDASGATL